MGKSTTCNALPEKTCGAMKHQLKSGNHIKLKINLNQRIPK